jgi:hypothetical protein
MNYPEDNGAHPDKKEAAKKVSHLNTLILAAVFLLGLVLPSTYKILAPFLFLVPWIISLVNKARKAGEISGSPSPAKAYSPSVHDQSQSVDPYSFTPKDPKDPRRYKPIG